MYAGEVPAFLFEWPLQLLARLFGRVLLDLPGYAICAGLYQDCAERSGLVVALSLGFWAGLAVVVWFVYRLRHGAQ